MSAIGLFYKTALNTLPLISTQTHWPKPLGRCPGLFLLSPETRVLAAEESSNPCTDPTECLAYIRFARTQCRR